MQQCASLTRCRHSDESANTHHLLNVTKEALPYLTDDVDHAKQLREAVQEFLSCARRVLAAKQQQQPPQSAATTLAAVPASSEPSLAPVDNNRIELIAKAKVKLARAMKDLVLAAQRGIATSSSSSQGILRISWPLLTKKWLRRRSCHGCVAAGGPVGVAGSSTSSSGAGSSSTHGQVRPSATSSGAANSGSTTTTMTSSGGNSAASPSSSSPTIRTRSKTDTKRDSRVDVLLLRLDKSLQPSGYAISIKSVALTAVLATMLRHCIFRASRAPDGAKPVAQGGAGARQPGRRLPAPLPAAATTTATPPSAAAPAGRGMGRGAGGTGGTVPNPRSAGRARPIATAPGTGAGNNNNNSNSSSSGGGGSAAAGAGVPTITTTSSAPAATGTPVVSSKPPPPSSASARPLPLARAKPAIVRELETGAPSYEREKRRSSTTFGAMLQDQACAVTRRWACVCGARMILANVRLSAFSLRWWWLVQGAKAEDKRKRTEVQMQSLKSLTVESYEMTKISLTEEEDAESSGHSLISKRRSRTDVYPLLVASLGPTAASSGGSAPSPVSIAISPAAQSPTASSSSSSSSSSQAPPSAAAASATSGQTLGTPAQSPGSLAVKGSGAFRRISNRISASLSPMDVIYTDLPTMTKDGACTRRTFFMEQLLANPELFTVASDPSPSEGHAKWILGLSPLSESLAQLIDTTQLMLNNAKEDQPVRVCPHHVRTTWVSARWY